MNKRDSYYINDDGPDQEAAKRGFVWLFAKAKQYNGGFLAIPTIRNLEGVISNILGYQIIKELRKNGFFSINGIQISLITDKKMIYQANNKPVLAMYIGEKILDKLDSISDISEILVVPWIMSEIKNWIKTWNATESGKPKLTEKSIVSNPVIEKALESLTASVNLSTGISHPFDRSRTIWTFKVLKEHNEHFSPDEIKSWLISRGRWKATAAQEASEIAAGVIAGKTFHAGNRMWVHNIVDMWRKEAGVNRDEVKKIESQETLVPIQRTSVSSSHIDSIGYHSTMQILEVAFRDGSIYRYFDVPEQKCVQLMNADSHGQFLARNIKSRYRYKRVV